MTRRLVLGCGTAARRSIERMAEWPGELVVLSRRGAVVDSFREESVNAGRRAPDDKEAYPDHADLVFVASDDATTNIDAARTAREAFPDAYIVGYLGQDADHERQRTLTSLVDGMVDGRTVLVNRLVSLTGGRSADRLHRLYRVLRDIDGRLAVVMHDNPDPDAIASALALCRIAENVGVPADPCYFGEISHQENRAFVNLLDLDLRRLEPGETGAEFDAVALVDHSRPGVNDSLPRDTDVDIVIDHHPPREPVEARFLDLRRDMGSTSTLLVDYLRRLNIDPGTTVATALLFGIWVDTKDFTREASPADFEAAAFCLADADLSVLQRVESPSMSSEVLETVARAIRNRDVRGEALATNVGEIRDRDALAQAADRLLGMDGVKITLVYGFKEGTVYVSGRTRGTEVDLGETLRDALGPIGSAGGHADMAGAQIPLGILGDVGEDSHASLEGIVSEVIAGRFFETLEDATMLLARDDDGTDLAFEFPMDEW